VTCRDCVRPPDRTAADARGLEPCWARIDESKGSLPPAFAALPAARSVQSRQLSSADGQSYENGETARRGVCQTLKDIEFVPLPLRTHTYDERKRTVSSRRLHPGTTGGRLPTCSARRPEAKRASGCRRLRESALEKFRGEGLRAPRFVVPRASARSRIVRTCVRFRL